MNYIHRKSLFYVLFVVATLFFSGCTKEWDEHYNQESFDLPQYSLFEYIETQSELSVFAGMIKAAGYDTIINASQTFTVWAPTNSALASVDLNNSSLVNEIVQNHIARNRYTTSMLDANSIRMLSGKNVSFSRGDSGFLFDDKSIITANLPTKNGLVHIINEYVPYMENIWEYIGNAASIDSLRDYFYGASKMEFHPEYSTEIGVNEDGNPVYDSIFLLENTVLSKIGNLSLEDTIFTVLLPNNDAWVESYEKIQSYFNIPEIYGGDVRKRDIVQSGIVQDLVYSGFVNEPSALDSLVSTTGNVFYNPEYLFTNATSVKLSNGLAYITDHLAFPDTISFLKEIRVEAESSLQRENSNSNIFSRSNYDVGISNNRYILVEPTGTSNIALANVTFSIPKTLSTAYNIYCVFVPNVFSNPNDSIPMKAKFALTYLRQTSGRTSRKVLTPDNPITDPNGLTKMLVGQFDFEFANINDEDYTDVVVTLEVTSNVKIDEAEEYSRSMRIDCVILEPVIQ